MTDLFLSIGISLSDEQKEKFKIFESLLEENNKIFNLTSIKAGRETYIKHFFDCVYAVDKFKNNSTVIEIGSGGGFPSVPLMIMRKDLKFTLLEATEKKCKYLEKVKTALSLNCEIINGRAEEIGKIDLYRGFFDHATARAVARLNVLSEYCLPFVKVGGSFIAYKGGDCEEEINEAKNAIRILGGRKAEEIKYSLPENSGNRTVIIIEKILKTPLTYPRGNGKERKSPII